MPELAEFNLHRTGQSSENSRQRAQFKRRPLELVLWLHLATNSKGDDARFADTSPHLLFSSLLILIPSAKDLSHPPRGRHFGVAKPEAGPSPRTSSFKLVA